MSGDPDRIEAAAEDLMALIEACAGEPVDHLAGFLTDRDERDLALLRGGRIDNGPRPAQHASPRRPFATLDRVLMAVILAALVALAVLAAVVASGGPASADDGAPHRWLAVDAAAWLLIVPGVVVLVVAAGCWALDAFERWYERGGGAP